MAFFKKEFGSQNPAQSTFRNSTFRKKKKYLFDKV